MRNRSPAKSAASSPPVPARTLEKYVVLVARIGGDEHLQERRLGGFEPLLGGEDFLGRQSAHGGIRIGEERLGRRQLALEIPEAAVAAPPGAAGARIPSTGRGIAASPRLFRAQPSNRPTSSKRSVILSMRWRIESFMGIGSCGSCGARHGQTLYSEFHESAWDQCLGESVMAAVVIVAGLARQRARPRPAPSRRKDPEYAHALGGARARARRLPAAAEDYAAAAMQSAVASGAARERSGTCLRESPGRVAVGAALAGAGARGCRRGHHLRRHRSEALQDPGRQSRRRRPSCKAAGANANERIGQLATAFLEEAEAPAVLAVMSAAVGPNPSPETLTLLAQLSLRGLRPGARRSVMRNRRYAPSRA
jgi:hypothetical protein